MKNGNYRGGGSKNCLLIFLSWSAKNPKFLNLNYQKAGTFCFPDKAKFFICHAFMINQQALLILDSRTSITFERDIFTSHLCFTGSG